MANNPPTCNSVSSPIKFAIWASVINPVTDKLIEGTTLTARWAPEPILGWFGDVRDHISPPLEQIVHPACVKKLNSNDKRSSV